LLAAELQHYAGKPGVLVLALPRGGVPVAFEVAKALGAPLDVFIVRKLGTPGQRELAMGAIASGGVQVLNEDIIRLLHIPAEAIEEVATDEREEMNRRELEYRGQRRPLDLRGRTVILVDDGLATGSTMHAAAAAVRQQHPERIVVAVPVAPRGTLFEFSSEADEVVSALIPEEPFEGVGRWYADFSQTTDDEVRELLERGSRDESDKPQFVVDSAPTD